MKIAKLQNLDDVTEHYVNDRKSDIDSMIPKWLSDDYSRYRFPLFAVCFRW